MRSEQSQLTQTLSREGKRELDLPMNLNQRTEGIRTITILTKVLTHHTL